MLNKVAYKIAKKIVECSDADKEEIYIYGLELIISTFFGLVSILLISCLLSRFTSGLVFISVFVPLRLFTGGFHAATYTRCFVISNISYASSVVAERINRLLPENAFEFIITSSNYIFRKPNKRIFDLALEKAGLEPDEVWYIGDQYECDVKGALNAGLLPVWYIGAVDLPYTEDTNILTVKTWNEIEQYMEG